MRVRSSQSTAHAATAAADSASARWRSKRSMASSADALSRRERAGAEKKKEQRDGERFLDHASSERKSVRFRNPS